MSKIITNLKVQIKIILYVLEQTFYYLGNTEKMILKTFSQDNISIELLIIDLKSINKNREKIPVSKVYLQKLKNISHYKIE